MSQGDLAFLVNVRRETIGNLENGKYNPSLKLALDIAKIFETTVEELFYFSDDTGIGHFHIAKARHFATHWTEPLFEVLSLLISIITRYRIGVCKN